MGKKTTLSIRQTAVLAELLAGKSISAAAEAVGIARCTLYRWQREPEFAAALLRLDGESMASLSRRVLTRSTDAVQALEDALQADQSINVRLRAAQIVLDRAVELSQMASLLQRLDALEARQSPAENHV